jgi:hypothetical protein
MHQPSLDATNRLGRIGISGYTGTRIIRLAGSIRNL